MKDQIFNANDLPWKDSEHGKTKVLVGDIQSKASRFRLFNLEAGKTFKTHEHDFTQCMYFTKGQGTVSIDDYEATIEPGLTVIVLPKQCHSIFNSGDDDMEIIVFETYEDNLQDTPFIDF